MSRPSVIFDDKKIKKKNIFIQAENYLMSAILMLIE